jgi:hypothetical protein
MPSTPVREMSEDPFERGHVVWHPALFKETGRPYLVLSDDAHPFHGTEYLVAGLTTTALLKPSSDDRFQ